MFSHRHTIFSLILTPLLLLFISSRMCWAQEAPTINQQAESEEEMFNTVERRIQSFSKRKDSELIAGVERQLKLILQLYPNTLRREWVEENLSQVQEIRGLRSLKIAQFYFNRGSGMKAAESRLLYITREFPNFSRMDEALLLLGKAYLKDEQPKQAANNFWKLACKYPGSQYTGEAFEQLSKMGINTSENCDSLTLK